MGEEASGWLWLIIDVGLVAALGAGLIYGTMMWRSRSRNRAVQQVRDEATKDLYKQRGQ
jgi:hypothetical protein